MGGKHTTRGFPYACHRKSNWAGFRNKRKQSFAGPPKSGHCVKGGKLYRMFLLILLLIQSVFFSNRGWYA